MKRCISSFLCNQGNQRGNDTAGDNCACVARDGLALLLVDGPLPAKPAGAISSASIVIIGRSSSSCKASRVRSHIEGGGGWGWGGVGGGGGSSMMGGKTDVVNEMTSRCSLPSLNDPLASIEGVLQQHRNRHGSDSARDLQRRRRQINCHVR